MQFSATAIIAALSVGTQVFAAPAGSSIETSLVTRAGSDPITIITGAINTLQGDVKVDLQDIATAVAAKESASDLGAAIQGDLVKILGAFSSAVSTIAPQVAIISVNITASEVQLLYANAQALEKVVSAIQSEFEELISTISSNTLAFIKPLLQAVVNIAESLANSLISSIPQTASANGAGGSSGQLQATSEQITSKLGSLSDQL